MNISKLSEPLKGGSIELRPAQFKRNAKGIVNMHLLMYKDARVDIKRLNQAVGALNWKREHTNNNANCIVSVWNVDAGEWASKEDTGSASNTEAGKGLASDSFKRACVNWGIGVELYTLPTVWIGLKDNEYWEKNGKISSGWALRLDQWKLYAEYNANHVCTFLALKDAEGNVRFTWGERNGESAYNTSGEEA
jgi:hypothetical protein